MTIAPEELRPLNAAQLAEMLEARNARAQRISKVDLRQLSRIVELTPEDMTVTVEAGITLAALQRELATHRQWLPIDPPNAEYTSIHEILSRDLSGPRRFGYGTIREHLIGMKVVLADGRIIKSGGKVVKNVAGYDLAKLFIGARDSVGIIVEATFKLRPLPEAEQFVSASVTLDDAKQALRSVFDSELTPVVIDMHRLGDAMLSTEGNEGNKDGNSSLASVGETSGITIVLGLAGTREEVEWQLSKARPLGFETRTGLDYETCFWNSPASVNRTSVLPSRLMEAIIELGSRPFVARAGNGVVYYRGERLRRADESPRELGRRIKNAYDPKNILPELSL